MSNAMKKSGTTGSMKKAMKVVKPVNSFVADAKLPDLDAWDAAKARFDGIYVSIERFDKLAKKVKNQEKKMKEQDKAIGAVGTRAVHNSKEIAELKAKFLKLEQEDTKRNNEKAKAVKKLCECFRRFSEMQMPEDAKKEAIALFEESLKALTGAEGGASSSSSAR